jgi:GH15 family glucan-1,4-alpha-glucosidase
MAARIEDYAIIGDTKTVALVDNAGSIDWWCVPRMDSGACFAALLGKPEHGRWLLRPRGEITSTRRRYFPETLVLETEYETPSGTAVVCDFMSPGEEHSTIFRIVECRTGTVDMEMELIVRFDYGSVPPWVQSTGDGLTMVAGSDALRFHSPVWLEGREDLATTAMFTIGEGHVRSFSLSWYSALDAPPTPLDAPASRIRTMSYWREWVERCTYDGEWRDEVIRSLITVKALSYEPTGAVIAAATTSLPEQIGGVRNWDYRYSWLRDASLTLQSLLLAGYSEEAEAWQQWLQRAVAGHPGDFQIMYGVGGERRLAEIELDWLPGYEGSKPVRVGNAASEQFQLDVFGEVIDAGWTAVQADLVQNRGDLPAHHPMPGQLLPAVLLHLENVWRDPDEGIWEIRGPRRHFTHSKVMAWVAFDRAIRIAIHRGWNHLPVEKWAQLRDEVHAQVCEQGFNTEKNCFVQSYGSDQLDASLLMLARVGFLPPDDPRIIGTIEAIERELVVDGFVLRYLTGVDGEVDGLPPGEGAFLMTTFWFADNLALIGRTDQAREVFERLRGLSNDVGLFAEEYDPKAKRMLGNFPQAFSHLAFVTSAAHLSMGADSPISKQSRGEVGD